MFFGGFGCILVGLGFVVACFCCGCWFGCFRIVVDDWWRCSCGCTGWFSLFLVGLVVDFDFLGFVVGGLFGLLGVV